MYKIKMQASGVDVNKALGSKSPYPHEKEFAVPNQINASDIVEVQPINK